MLTRCLSGGPSILQTWLLFVLLSVVSMAMGFYDLWKNVPYFKQFVVSMFRPAAAVFEWLEGHTQVGFVILVLALPCALHERLQPVTCDAGSLQRLHVVQSRMLFLDAAGQHCRRTVHLLSP